MEKYIAISGNPLDGCVFHGPFDSMKEVQKWAGEHLAGDWWIAPLLVPETVQDLIEQMRQALEPFAAMPFDAGDAGKLADDVVLLNTGSAIADKQVITVGDFRRARAVFVALSRVGVIP